MSDVQVQRQLAEGKRRRLEGIKRSERVASLEAELVQSIKINQDIEAKWSTVAQLTVPEELYQEIGKQYQQSSALIQAKEQLIRSLQRELKEKDEEYVALLSQHQEDIVQIVRAMQEQFHLHLQTCREQLAEIEREFANERSVLVQSNVKEIVEIFEKRSKMEMTILTNAKVK